LLGVVFVAWVASSRDDPAHVLAPTSRAKAEVELAASSLYTTSDSPTPSRTGKLRDWQCALSATKASSIGVEAPPIVGTHLTDSTSLTCVGPFGCLLAGRGPPLA
jgi:hypothetical protein